MHDNQHIMSLFEGAIQAHYPNVVDTPIHIGGHFNYAIDNPAVREALDTIQGDSITKLDLLKIWEDESRYSFKTKFLLTLFWGHVRPKNLEFILNDHDLDYKLDGLERALHGFEDFRDETIDKHHPYDDIQELYSKLECGCLKIKGLGVAFFTKIFFFFFATHKTFFSFNKTQIIIADEWMRKAVYAEFAETYPQMLDDIFCPGAKYPCGFRKRNGNTSEAFFWFLKAFEAKRMQLGIDSLTLESYIFASKDLIRQHYSRAII